MTTNRTYTHHPARVCPLCRAITARLHCSACARRGLAIPTLTREQLTARLDCADAGADLFIAAQNALQRFEVRR